MHCCRFWETQQNQTGYDSEIQTYASNTGPYLEGREQQRRVYTRTILLGNCLRDNVILMHKLEVNTTWPSKELAIIAGPQETHFPHCTSMVGGKIEGSGSSMPPEAFPNSHLGNADWTSALLWF